MEAVKLTICGAVPMPVGIQVLAILLGSRLSVCCNRVFHVDPVPSELIYQLNKAKLDLWGKYCGSRCVPE